MASIKEIRSLYQSPRALTSNPSPLSGTSLPPSTRTRSAGGNPYDAAGTGRRMMEFQPSRLGPTSGLWGTLDLIRARCRDEVRNNPYATSAIDTFEAQVSGNGIKPKWNIEDETVKLTVEREWNRWALSTSCDVDGRLNFYGLQALAVREVFEAGEVFNRAYVRPSSWKMRIPLQYELIEAEQCPVWQNSLAGGASTGIMGMPSENSVCTGVERDPYKRRVAYHMYREHPGETMFFPSSALTFVRVPADDISHIYKPLRAGQLRGQPMLTSVLTLLHTLEKYTDAALVLKEIQTMFAGFIKKNDPGSDVLPPDSVNVPSDGSPANAYEPGVQNSRLETGTVQVLLPGEDITFPQLPQNNDIETFLNVQLHKFCAGVGMTFEQITGNLKGVTYSSIRAGLLDFRRKCEQFQINIIIQQFCQPIAKRWLFEAVMAGVLVLPGYAKDPYDYEDITWNPPGWDWVDPLKDIQAAQIAVRSGFDSREAIVAEKGKDVATVDNQIAADKKRTDRLGLTLDTDPCKILLKGSQNPDVAPEQDPDDAGTNAAEETASES